MNLKLPKLAAVFTVFLLCIQFTAQAQSKTHTVQKGETLFSIAEKYGINIQQIKKWNNLDGNSISVGQSLTIKPDAKKDAIVHTVEPQETLFSIAKQYNVRIAEIKAWNELSNNSLDVGQQLKVYPSEDDNKEEQSVVVDKKTQQNSYYVVKSGDSLYKIAQEHGMTINELKTLNDLSSNTIRIGQRLTVRSNTVPPSVARTTESSPQGKFLIYEVSGGSISLQNLLKKFKMTKQEFQALNPTVEETNFHSGRKLTVLAPPNRKYENPYLSDANLQDLGETAVSRYGNSEAAKPTTSGELYNPNSLTAAHSNISLGSVIFIKNPENQKGIYVRINDRNSGNGLKLSLAAWQTLDFKSSSPKVTIYQNE